LAPDLSGAIVLVENADPGFDWLFGKRIGGLITAYGGSNSHMAIRAAELGLPAVIGAGDKLFEIWSRARHLRIDCGVESVEVLA
jgi:phosphoenolpyruvate-protein kinase (PTS system EI component)